MGLDITLTGNRKTFILRLLFKRLLLKFSSLGSYSAEFHQQLTTISQAIYDSGKTQCNLSLG